MGFKTPGNIDRNRTYQATGVQTATIKTVYISSQSNNTFLEVELVVINNNNNSSNI